MGIYQWLEAGSNITGNCPQLKFREAILRQINAQIAVWRGLWQQNACKASPALVFAVQNFRVIVELFPAKNFTQTLTDAARAIHRVLKRSTVHNA